MPSGKITVVVLGFNRGIEDENVIELSDDEFKNRKDLERYEIYIEQTS